MCVAFRSVEALPSPKSQNQAVTFPLEVSVNCTARGAFPSPGTNVNPAEGAGRTRTASVTAEMLNP
jgi:hypothetical protein